MTLPPGTQVGRFVVEEVLGVGGMGMVYLAFDPSLGRKVALKLLRARARRAEAQARLVREAQALARLAHPNVIVVYEVGTVGDDVFLAEEVVSGGRPVQAAEQVEQRGLARAGRAHQGDEVPFLDGQRHALQGLDGVRFEVVILDQADDADDGGHRLPSLARVHAKPQAARAAIEY